jgi:hypothetical protein
VRGGSPWIFGKHALILQDYDERLRPSEIGFDRLEIWARILNIPLGWMNETCGSRAMSLIGEVRKMDVDKHGKANGPFLRARVAIDINKPVRRGVMLHTKKAGDPEWFDVQYEKRSFYCLNCGVMGHSELQCADLVLRMKLVNYRMMLGYVHKMIEGRGSRIWWRRRQLRIRVPCLLQLGTRRRVSLVCTRMLKELNKICGRMMKSPHRLRQGSIHRRPGRKGRI